MIGRKRWSRLLTQLACFAAAIVLLWPLPFWKSAPKLVVQISPFVAICSGIALRAIGIGTGIGFAFAVIALWHRRWFCRYSCPTGLLLECASNVGLRKTSWWNRCPRLDRYIVLITVTGAAVGYPILLWMDPLSLFSSFLGIRTAGNVPSIILAGLGLSILIMLSLASGGIWCARLCPLGGLQDLLASAGSLLTGKRQSALEPLPAASPHRPAVLARRVVLFGAIGIGIGLLAKKVGAARGDNAPLRPPGAVAESHFCGLCVRCGSCVRACPSKIIRPDAGQGGVAGLLAPGIRYESTYCLEDCIACMQVCPSGALQALDLAEKRRYVIGEAVVDASLCLLALGRRDCDACMRSCPFDAVRIHWDEDQYIAYPVLDKAKCNGCGACEAVCPAYGIKAIQVWKIAG